MHLSQIGSEILSLKYQPGMGIVHGNANFCGNVTNFLRRKTNCLQGKEIKDTKNKNKQTNRQQQQGAPILVLYQIPIKHMKYIHT